MATGKYTNETIRRAEQQIISDQRTLDTYKRLTQSLKARLVTADKSKTESEKKMKESEVALEKARNVFKTAEETNRKAIEFFKKSNEQFFKAREELSENRRHIDELSHNITLARNTVSSQERLLIEKEKRNFRK